MNLSWLYFAIPVMMVIYWVMTEAIMWKVAIRPRKWAVRILLVLLYGMMFFSIWHSADGLAPAKPKPPKGPEIVLSCWVSSPKDEVVIDFTGMSASPVSAYFKDASGPFAMDCQYQFEEPKLQGWQYTEEGNPGIQ
jgi:hypothetical protein